MAAPPAASVQVELTPSKNVVYVNELFSLTLTVRISGVNLQKNMELLDLPGADKLEMSAFEELPPERRMAGGVVVEIRRSRCQARALRPGTIELKPKLRVLVITKRFPGSILFPEESSVTRYDVTIPPCVIESRSLPKPEDGVVFSGAVGAFSMDVSVSPTNIAPGSLVKVVSHISGTGYLTGVLAPVMPLVPKLKIYEPRLAYSNTDEVVFERDVVPQSSDVSEIPPLSFTFFDPAAERYVTLSEGPFGLTFVEAGGTTSKAPDYAPPLTAHVKVPPQPAAAREGFGRSFRFWTWCAVSALLLALIAILCSLLANRTASRLQPVAAVIARVAALIALGCMWYAAHVRRLERISDVVIRREHALYAPRKGAERLFSIPAGVQVGIAETYDGWVRVVWNKRSGWIPADALLTRQEAEASGSSR